MNLVEYDWDSIASKLSLEVIYTSSGDICLMSRGCNEFHKKTQLNFYDNGKSLILIQTLPQAKHYGQIEYKDKFSIEELVIKIKEKLNG
jgi:hypothetical protein